MPSWEELEKRTLWDVTTNESPGVLLTLSLGFLIISIIYGVVGIWYWIRSSRLFTRKFTRQE